MSRGILGLLAFLTGVAAAIVLSGGPVARIFVAAAATPLVLLVLFRRKSWLVYGFLLSVFVTEEFLPKALLEPDLDPTRIILEGGRIGFTDPRATFLYSESIGLRGLYAVEVLLGALLAVFLWSALRQRRRLPFVQDSAFVPMMLTILSIAVSVTVSLFIFPDATSKEAYRFDEIEIGLDAEVAALVPYFQFKAWTYVYLSYALTRLLVVNQEMARRFLVTVLASVIGIIIVGSWRVFQMRTGALPHGAVYYDDATLFVMIVFLCFIMLGWNRRLFQPRSLWWQLPGVAASLGILVLSPRRATWMGAGICFLVLLALVSKRQRRHLLAGGAGAGLIALIYIVAVGAPGSIDFESVGRDASAVYRAALFHNLVRFEQFTLLGYGVTPLWNVPLIMGAFQFNFESVHSLYYWFILRTGLVGLAIFLLLIFRTLKTCFEVRRAAAAPWLAAFAETLVIALILYLFLGLFHPVYAMARFAIFLGVLVGLAMAMVPINRDTQARLQSQL